MTWCHWHISSATLASISFACASPNNTRTISTAQGRNKLSLMVCLFCCAIWKAKPALRNSKSRLWSSIMKFPPLYSANPTPSLFRTVFFSDEFQNLLRKPLLGPDSSYEYPTFFPAIRSGYHLKICAMKPRKKIAEIWCISFTKDPCWMCCECGGTFTIFIKKYVTDTPGNSYGLS